jgi:hypothetical protein
MSGLGTTKEPSVRKKKREAVKRREMKTTMLLGVT